jgi:hypothetical protein
MITFIALIVVGTFILAMLEAAKRMTVATEATALVLLIAILEARSRAKRHD